MAPPGTPTETTFEDRRDAGRRLAERLRRFVPERPVVVGLPRGGVPVAYEIARALDAPLDVLVVRKIGHPQQPEFGVGAVGEDGTVLLNRSVVDMLGLSEEELEPVVEHERAEVQRRRERYRGGREPIGVDGRTVLLVDDGIATGGTAAAAARVLRGRGAAKVVLAVPVGPPGVGERLRDEVDEVVCLLQPPDLFAVGQAYRDFAPTRDGEVAALLADAAAATDPPAPRAAARRRARRSSPSARRRR